MDAINRAANAVGAKNEVYAASMHMFHFTDFPQQLGELLRQAPALDVARLAMWRTGSADDRHIPSPETEGVAFSAPGFSLVKSCNPVRMARRDHDKITLDHGATHLAGTRVNPESMYNDLSQMPEAPRRDSASQLLEHLRKATRVTDAARFPATWIRCPQA